MRLFRGLDTAFSIVYDAGLEKSIIGQIINAVIVFGAIIIAAMGMIALGTILVVLPDVPFGFFTPLFLIAGLTLVFLPMYYLPDIETISVKQALPGSFLAATGWTILHTLFGLYASNAGQYDAYGVIGAILLLLTWLYVGGIIIILGALLNYVLMDREDELPDDAEAADRSPLDLMSRKARRIATRHANRTVQGYSSIPALEPLLSFEGERSVSNTASIPPTAIELLDRAD